MREIVLDTETTGMDPEDGHRIIEIGCVELDNHVPTGRHLQIYINPERDIPPEATAVHGITNAFVSDKPVFLEVYTEFVDFIGDAKLVIHNAEFDMKFINHHLLQFGHKSVPWPRVVDTLALARRKFPGSPANLDALCRRFGFDNTERTYHGALLDSELLAEVYLELLGGRQHGLALGGEKSEAAVRDTGGLVNKKRQFRDPRQLVATEAERLAHKDLMQEIGSTLWD